MKKIGQWKKEREIVSVETFIRTKDNNLYLYALLCSLATQTKIPKRITILNTGEELSSEVCKVLNLFNEVKIMNKSNEDYFDRDGVFNHSYQVIDAIKSFEYELVWFLDSDIFLPSNCLEELLEEIPSIPDYIIEYDIFDFEDQDKVIHCGILAKKEDWLRVIPYLEKKKYPKFGEDCIVNRVINPRVCKNTYFIHLRNHSELHKLVYVELHNQLWEGI